MKKLILFAAVSIAVVACTTSAEVDPTQEENLVESQPHTKVSVVQAEKRMFEHYFEIQGAIHADKNIIVVPEAAGLIKSLPVREGQMVQQGETIALLDSRLINANKKEIEEQLNLAEYMYEKQKGLYEQGIGTEVALKQAETQYEALKKTLNTIGTQESMYQVKAPFTGYVEEVYVTEGSMAAPTSPMIRLIGLDKMSVKADISEVYVKSVDKNSTAQLSFPAIDEELSGLKVKRLGKFVNPANRTVVLEVDIPNPSDKMIPNMMSVIKVRDYSDTAAIVIPSRTILRDMEQKPYVYVLEGDKVVETKIETGPSTDGYTQVLKGLEANQQVVDKGSRGVKDQQKVVVQ